MGSHYKCAESICRKSSLCVSGALRHGHCGEDGSPQRAFGNSCLRRGRHDLPELRLTVRDRSASSTKHTDRLNRGNGRERALVVISETFGGNP
jgi:hypothetical protein